MRGRSEALASTPPWAKLLRKVAAGRVGREAEHVWLRGGAEQGEFHAYLYDRCAASARQQFLGYKRPAWAAPSLTSFDPDTRGTAKSGTPHRVTRLKERRDHVLPVILHAARAATA